MIYLSSVLASVMLALSGVPGPRRGGEDLNAALISVKQADSARMRALRAEQHNAIVVQIVDGEHRAAKRAADRVRRAKFGLYYWIEVGRSAKLADAHPEWMASLQGHPEWRRYHPSFPQPSEGEVVKCYPWVPVSYRESFDGHLKRIRNLLKGLPKPDGVFLNDLQSAPSACGCGNTLCRWTNDYGPIVTATPLGPDSAARFVGEVRKLTPGVEVIPVWLSECQEHESKKGAACDGVSCFGGLCWVEWTKQLTPLAESVFRIGTLSTHKSFSLPESWIDSSISAFQKMPPLRNGTAISVRRIISVVQGWNCGAEERMRFAKRAVAAGAHGTVTALTPINQSWIPRIVKVKW